MILKLMKDDKCHLACIWWAGQFCVCWTGQVINYVFANNVFANKK